MDFGVMPFVVVILFVLSVAALTLARTERPVFKNWRVARIVVALGLLAWALLFCQPAEAQITRDSSLTPAATLSGPNYVLGVVDQARQIRGNNLFHSFGQFNVQTGESATFTGPNNIA